MPIAGDYHMHTPLCQHASGPIEAYVEQAVTLGLAEIGFSDHSPLPGQLGADVRMRESELDYYVNRVVDLRYQYRGRLTILLGLELDYLEGLEGYARALTGRYPWDYIIGSVHYLDAGAEQSAWPYHYPGDVRALYARYFTLLRQMVRTGLYDIVGHFDIPKRSGHLPTTAEADDIAASLQEIAASGMAMEINTSGYRHRELPRPESYPSLGIIEQAIALGIPLVLNSDAHAPEQVGFRFPEMRVALQQRGLTTLARWEQRELSRYEL